MRKSFGHDHFVDLDQRKVIFHFGIPSLRRYRPSKHDVGGRRACLLPLTGNQGADLAPGFAWVRGTDRFEVLPARIYELEPVPVHFSTRVVFGSRNSMISADRAGRARELLVSFLQRRKLQN
jgi:hypothetical protein